MEVGVVEGRRSRGGGLWWLGVAGMERGRVEKGKMNMKKEEEEYWVEGGGGGRGGGGGADRGGQWQWWWRAEFRWRRRIGMNSKNED
ncbi:hypothetical protein TIFTF001_042547 [Ficus carica]|uniref:Uncharacterized protein n=1 Tax=Ficus carica TaxID=3494 RepID=A0AA88DFP0_FICCA|nr:hypothetical protein TIFTF001_042544 [Ficus carica]GMN36969.1 hypothetical protein TIFTF001_042547 [Ficus carica]